MALTLNAEQKSIYDIFSGENQYIIPPYQRAYSWTNVQCKALFEDIKKAFYDSEQEGYFLGNIVLAKSREERNKLEVIDGQQRLTTLILLIKVLLSFDKENKALYNAIWIKDRRTDEEIQRLETNIFMEQDYNYFKEVLAFDFSDNICESINKEDNFFKQNICYFYNKLKEFSQNNDIFKFSDFLLDKIYILPIETEDNDADKAREKALKIFETINNRGINLSTSDIFKARLYSMALNQLEHKNFIKEWEKINLKSQKNKKNLDDIFTYYRYAIEGELGIIPTPMNSYQNLKLREFFLNEKYSPFFQKEYMEIMNDLLRIVDSLSYIPQIIENPKKYGIITKWFQLLSLFECKEIEIGLIIFLYKNNLNFDEKLENFCKDYMKYIFSAIPYSYYDDDLYKDKCNIELDDLLIKIMNNKKVTYKRSKISKINIEFDNVNLLLNYYLNSNVKAEYPFDEILNQLKKEADEFDPYTQIENLENLKKFLES